MKYFYEDKLLCFKINGKLHEKIVLHNNNYINHIKKRHSDINLKKIEEILYAPDYVYKRSNKSKDYYYEKNFNGDIYRVVIDDYKKHVKKVVTAYKIDHKDEFTTKHIYCIYDKETFVEYAEINKDLEDDFEYFYDLFNIAE
ncbi:hypothetical protein CSC2_06380 [Clostridium zeae]|uniref:Phage-Barnase-EndoU-ColicinE5/D-RelE like nuclease 3 domain-containing protein n=1 Tax=Clostridium zeae TaxID=2759022 RepID=A0ABQ1E5T7_9CLOT|nr:hypothetical protein [Clostridium zeae]GFZ30112.1 hypothetical protein CSC2_06380 [Clostridium zeae]